MRNLFLLALSGFTLFSCTSNSTGSSAEEPTWPKSEIVKTDLGFGEIYGVKLTDFSATASAKAYRVQLNQGSQVWIDTLYLDLNANDTVMSDIYFGEATAQDTTPTTHRIELLNAE